MNNPQFLSIIVIDYMFVFDKLKNNKSVVQVIVISQLGNE